MKKFFQEMVLAVKILMLERRYLITWFVSAFAFYALLILIPVWTTPGNDILFQFYVLGPTVSIVLALLAILNGLLIAMQAYGFAHSRKSDSYTFGGSVFGVVTGFVVSIFSCAACYSTLLAVTGLGVATFFIQYRVILLTATFLIVLWAIYKNAQRILGHCETCKLTS